MKTWCLGFVLDLDLSTVLLIKKSKSIHIGMWNGIGGKVEPGETPLEAMVRECKEETGLDTTLEEWIKVGHLNGFASDGPWVVYVYATRRNLHGMKSMIGATDDAVGKAQSDTPYRFSVSFLRYLDTVPHTEVLAVASRVRLSNPSIRPLHILET